VRSGGERQFERIQDMLAFISDQLMHRQSNLIACEHSSD
jgi:hypothetical protein